ncbi:MAG TPA: tail fiber protein [Solirubrobacteraceae bacterium]
MFGGNFAPVNWAVCSGQVIAISQNDTLYSLIGTTYGGDGVNTFNLPDLRSRVPVHQGQGTGLSNYVIGQVAGVENVTLTTNQIPSHTHTISANAATGDQTSPTNTVLAGGDGVSRYVAGTPATAMSNQAVNSQGGSQPHTNLQPLLAVTFIICLYGVYPSRN